MPEESKLAEKLENSQKFTEEELKEVQNIQTSYTNIQNQFGQLSITKIRLQEQLNNLEKANENNIKAFNDLQDKEKKFLDEITKKYGEGTLNPETGEFTQNKS